MLKFILTSLLMLYLLWLIIQIIKIDIKINNIIKNKNKNNG